MSSKWTKLINHNNSKYDIIIGSDLMSDLNIDLRYSEEQITWGNPASNDEYDSIPMKELGILNDKDTCQQIYDLHTDSLLLQQEEERQSKILDADYTKVNINSIVGK